MQKLSDGRFQFDITGHTSGTASFVSAKINGTKIGLTANAVIVVPGPVASLRWKSPVISTNASYIAGDNLNPTSGTSPVIETIDALGNLTTNFNSNISIELVPPSGITTSILSGVLTHATGSAANVTFNSLSVNRVGTGYALRAKIPAAPSVNPITTNLFNITAAAAAKLSLAQSPAASTRAGISIGSIAVNLLDRFDNVVTSNSTAVVNATLVPNASGGILSGTSGRTASSGVSTFNDLSLNKIASNYQITFSCTVGSTQLTPVTTGNFSVTHGNAHHLLFSSFPVAAELAAPITPVPIVSILDANDNLVSTGPDSTASLTLTLTSGSGTPSGLAPVNALGGIATFSNPISFDRIGPKVFTVKKDSTTASGGVGDLYAISSSIQVRDPFTGLTLSGNSATTVGTCEAYSVTMIQVATGAPLAAGTPKVIQLLGQNLGQFYSDSSCRNPLGASKVTIQAGQSQAPFYLRSTRPITTVLMARSDSTAQATLPVVISTANGAALLSTSGSTTIKNGDCAKYTLAMKDADNNPVIITDNTAIKLFGGGSGLFYGTNTCGGTAINSVTMLAGTSQVDYYFRDTTIENVTLVASTTNIPDATVGVNVGVGGPTYRLSFSTPSQTSAGGCAPLTLSAYKTFGNNELQVNPTGPITVKLNSQALGLSAGYFYDSANCSGPVVTSAIFTPAQSTHALSFQDLSGANSTLEAIPTDPDIGIARTTLTSASPVYAETAPGSRHICVRTDRGGIICWGTGDHGQLGLKTKNSSGVPTVLPGISNVTQLVSGEDFSCALMADSSVKCWGLGSDCRNGLVCGSDITSPTAILGLSGVTKLSAGFAHTCALMSDGTAKCWGKNSDGQLGNGANTSTSTPVQVLAAGGTTALTSLTGITAGDTHSCATKSNGTAVCWGNNSRGQLGDTTLTNNTKAVGVSLDAGTTVTKIVAGREFTCLQDSLNKLYCFGSNDYAKAGRVNDSANPSSMMSWWHNINGSSFTIPMADGPLNILDDSQNPISPALKSFSLGTGTACVLTLSGTVHCWGHAYMGLVGQYYPTFNSDCGWWGCSRISSALQVPGLSNATQLSLRNGLSCVVYDTGASVGCWGRPGEVDTWAWEDSTYHNFGTNDPDYWGLGSGYVYEIDNVRKVKFPFPRTVMPWALTLENAAPSLTQASDTDCIPVRLSAKQSSDGSIIPFPSSGTVNLNWTWTPNGSAGPQTFADSACSQSLSAVPISIGRDSVMFYTRFPAYGVNATVTASLANYTNGTLSLSSAGTIANFKIRHMASNSTDSVALDPGTCEAVKLTLTSSNGGSVNPPDSPLEFDLMTRANGDNAAGPTRIYSDPNCQTARLKIRIEKGATETPIFYVGSWSEADLPVQLTANSSASNTIAVGGSGFNFLSPSLSANPENPYLHRPGECTRVDISPTNGVWTKTSVHFRSDDTLATFYANPYCQGDMLPSLSILGSGSITMGIRFSDSPGPNPNFYVDRGATNITTVPYYFDSSSYDTSVNVLNLSGTVHPALGACNVYNVSITDLAGNPSPTTADKTINLAAPPDGSSFYDTASCDHAVASVLIPNGASTKDFYFKSSIPLSTIIIASSANTRQTSYPVTVVSTSTATQLTWSGPANSNPGVCQAYLLQSSDPSGNAANMDIPLITQITAPSWVGLYQDVGCSQALNNKTIAQGASSLMIYIKASLSDAFVMRADSSRFARAEVSISGPLTNPVKEKILLSGPTLAPTMLDCVAITAKHVNTLGVESAVAQDTSLTISNGGLGDLYSNSTCTVGLNAPAIPQGQSKLTFYLSSPTSDKITLLAQAPAQDILSSTLQVNFGLLNASSVSAGTNHVCSVVGADNRVICWGYNAKGQLGNGTTATTLRRTPVAAIGINNVDKIVSGSEFSCALLQDKTVKCWGRNDSGQLGLSGTSDQVVPTTVQALTNVQDLTAGYNFACALTTTQNIFCWGANNQGQVGLGSGAAAKVLTPSAVATSKPVLQVAAGYDHACALLNDNTVWCWGGNSQGQSGLPTQARSPTKVASLSGATAIASSRTGSCALLSDGHVNCWGGYETRAVGLNTNSSTPIQIGLDRPVAKLFASSTRSGACTLSTDSEAWCWGNGLTDFGIDGSTAAQKPARVQILDGIPNLTSNEMVFCYVVGNKTNCTGSDTLTGSGERSGRSFFEAQSLSSLWIDAVTPEAGGQGKYRNCDALELKLKAVDADYIPFSPVDVTLASASELDDINLRGQFYSEATCSVPLTNQAIRFPAGQPSQRVYYKQLTSEGNFQLHARTVEGSPRYMGQISYGITGEAAAASPPSFYLGVQNSIVTQFPQAMQCVEAKLTFVDAAGQPMKTPGTLTYNITDYNWYGYPFYGTLADCNQVDGSNNHIGPQINELVVPAGQTEYSFYFLPQYNGQWQAFYIYPSNPSTQQITGDWLYFQLDVGGPFRNMSLNPWPTYPEGYNLGLGVCTPLNLSFNSFPFDDVANMGLTDWNWDGNVTNSSWDGSVVEFHTQSDCSDGATNTVTIPAYTSSLTVYMKMTTMGSSYWSIYPDVISHPSSFQWSNSLTGWTWFSMSPTQPYLTPVLGAQIYSGQCNPMLVDFMDPGSNGRQGNGGFASLQLQSSTSAQFYTNSGCTTPISTYTMQAGQKIGLVFFKDSPATPDGQTIDFNVITSGVTAVTSTYAVVVGALPGQTITNTGFVNDASLTANYDAAFSNTAGTGPANTCVDSGLSWTNLVDPTHPILLPDATFPTTCQPLSSGWSGLAPQYLTFDGNIDYAQVPSSLVQDLQDYTLEFWINDHTTCSWPGAYSAIADFGSSSDNGLGIWQESPWAGCRFRVQMRRTGQPEQDVDATRALNVDNQWTHVVITYSKDNSRLTIYFNGVQDTQSTNFTSSFADLGTIENAMIGRGWMYYNQWWGTTGGSIYWNGDLSVFRIYNRELSGTEVISNFNGTKARYGRQ